MTQSGLDCINRTFRGNGKRNLAVSKPSGQYLVVRKGYEHPDAVVKALSVEYEGLRLKDPAAAEIYKGLGVSWLNWPLNLQLNNENTVYENYQLLKSAVEAKDSASLPADQIPNYESIMKNLGKTKTGYRSLRQLPCVLCRRQRSWFR